MSKKDKDNKIGKMIMTVVVSVLVVIGLLYLGLALTR